MNEKNICLKLKSHTNNCQMPINNHSLKLEDCLSIIFKHTTVQIDETVKQKVEESFNFLQEFSQNKIIYGVNTGFGPMAQYKISDDERYQLQFNLIRSHASGFGTPLNPLMVKGAMLARLNTLSLGYSGVHYSVLELMQSFINEDITPLIFAHGSVGASGDLVQLAHLALTLIGEGEVYYKGERRPTQSVMDQLNLQPIDMHIREGLALMNGTSVMTGIGLVNYHYAKILMDWSIICSCAINEIVRTYDDHYSEALNGVKLHKGQEEVAKIMRNYMMDSKLTKKRSEVLYKGEQNQTIFKEKVQEYYSLRCVPQILGPIWDTINNVGEVLENEVNSANDNPIIDVKTQNVYHGGNFHGDYISLEMDKLKIVITKLTMLAERQLNYLLNTKINEILPPFVNLGKLGFNFGMQGVQFTATSTTAESQTLSNPMYVHSIPNNNDNQDIVSMGTNAAVLANKVIENAFEVLSIHMITIAQAIDALNLKEELSSKSTELYNLIRAIIPTFKEDKAIYTYLEQVKSTLMNQ